ncbi:glycosyl transferase [Siphonobacter sp. BAB-5385]|uniref:glycosyl transferase n=1 Tax=Siphonobacter sp. BAB-5385 TaxID=1864822 RepID=UPI000B9E6CEB|nr:glycosyl transferase [Siphonobacter sp. BAB-5385]OZI06032.1 glycosyl transferase [Siphonobacter sp. BAB-5385]
MLYFCTLFDSAYLSRGLALYTSLEEHCPSFHLYILPFDSHCQQVLEALSLPHATLISLADFENEELLAVKGSRTRGEYCWTCTPSLLSYCLHTYSLEACTYLDADLLFFSDPGVLIQEMGKASVLITEHRYSPEYDQSVLCGIYCVQFMTFKRTPAGLHVLNWWKDACLDWCYRRFEDGKFGDQKYLDDWTTRFEGVHVLKHLGGGVAPWNNTRYDYVEANDQVWVRDSSVASPLVFYHFHDFRYCQDETFRLTNEEYRLRKEVIALVYKPYVKALQAAAQRIRQADPTACFHEPPFSLDWLTTNAGRRVTFLLKGSYKNYHKHTRLWQ